jgi:hypothetical protein
MEHSISSTFRMAQVARGRLHALARKLHSTTNNWTATADKRDRQAAKARRRLANGPAMASAARSLAAAETVLRAFDAEYQRLREVDPERAASFYASLVPSSANLLPAHAEPNALKYLRQAEGHVYKWATYFHPHMASVRKGYELGVGPGYLFRLLMDVYGMEMRGCDLNPDRNLIFRELRKELKIADLVDVHEVGSGGDIPIPEDCDAVMGFWTVFTERWSVHDHIWFLDHCRERLVGEKQVFLLFNSDGYDNCPEVQAFYRRRAEFPLRDNAMCDLHERDKNAFCIVRL